MSGSPSNAHWTNSDLVAVDLEGTGAQDRDDEAILEIALVPIIAGLPHMPTSYSTLINPGRPVGRRPWLSPGLTDVALRNAPTLQTVANHLAKRINGRYLVGHNVAVDWRLLHRRLPAIQPAGLIDTLRLSRAVGGRREHSLARLVAEMGITGHVTAAAPDSRPHRALWDATAAAMLLPALAAHRPKDVQTLGALLQDAGVPLAPADASAESAAQPALF